MDMTPGLSLKPPTTYREQIDILKHRGLIIPDEDFAAEVLSNVNYYRFSAYLLPFRIDNGENYVVGTSFNRVYRVYEFDHRLRHTLMSTIEPIEVLLRTTRLYYQHLVALPRLPQGRFVSSSGKIFDAIYVMKYLYPDHTKWKSSFVQPLHALVTEYQEDIDLAHVGFPPNWVELLEQPTK